MAFAENVRKYRELKGMSQLVLANELGVVQSTIARYEMGMKLPNIITGVQLAKILGTTVEKLVEQEEQK
jgi:transcriptional regulator with XRE-family HTH domain